MKFNALVKDLIRYNWLGALAIVAWVLIFLHISRIGTSMPFIYSLLVGTRFLFAGFINILVLVMIPRFRPSMPEKKKKFLRYLIGSLVVLILFICTDPLEHFLTIPDKGPWIVTERLLAILMQTVMTNGLVIIMQNFIILQHEKRNIDLENSQLRAANLESANLLLKQQVHPHFLFNSLSMLKSLYKEDVHAGEAYLSHLVNFLRASLAGTQSRVSGLSEEIRLCNDYLQMQKIRFDNALLCTIDIPEEVLSQGSVPSFSIQSLIENAIKHNEVTEISPLVIKVYYKDGRIITENNLQPKTHTDTPSGKGLINLIERYKILSDEEVTIHQDNNTFSVSIKVLKNEDSNHRR